MNADFQPTTSNEQPTTRLPLRTRPAPPASFLSPITYHSSSLACPLAFVPLPAKKYLTPLIPPGLYSGNRLRQSTKARAGLGPALAEQPRVTGGKKRSFFPAFSLAFPACGRQNTFQRWTLDEAATSAMSSPVWARLVWLVGA